MPSRRTNATSAAVALVLGRASGDLGSESSFSCAALLAAAALPAFSARSVGADDAAEPGVRCVGVANGVPDGVPDGVLSNSCSFGFHIWRLPTFSCSGCVRIRSVCSTTSRSASRIFFASF